MSRAWLLDVLDRELPDVVGAKRDALAEKILGALPMKQIANAIAEAAVSTMNVALETNTRVSEIALASDIGNNGAMSVVDTLLAGDED